MTKSFVKETIKSVLQNPDYGYNGRIHEIRKREYSHLGGTSFCGLADLETTYLDHAGATIYPVSIVYDHCDDLASNLLSNPHSQSPSSIATEHRITAVRRRVLQAFNADPEFFDIVFVANATAGIKLIADGFAGSPEGFRYKYLRDAHTSLIGAGELSVERQAVSEEEVKKWLVSGDIVKVDNRPGLFAYPAQSNFNGRRFPLDWPAWLREGGSSWYSLLDASSYLTTTPLDYSNLMNAPDFTVFSFYKIFGYPDLGGVIVRRSAGHMLVQRRFFGGGTRSTLTADGVNTPNKDLHTSLEDGTLPFHNILALEHAYNNFYRLFGHQINVARHAALVTRVAYTLLSSLHYDNGQPVCIIYSAMNQGPIISFNLVNPDGEFIGFVSVEKQATVHNFACRTGGMCNPGGVQKYNELEQGELERMFAAGKICGDSNDIVHGKFVGALRISFGACSTIEEVLSFANFIRKTYVESRKPKPILWRSMSRVFSKDMRHIAAEIRF
jgi:molybdenum cofactor sulfurtransferase